MTTQNTPHPVQDFYGFLTMPFGKDFEVAHTFRSPALDNAVSMFCLGIETEDLLLLTGPIGGGKSVALVTDAGTPGISDPGFLLVREARAAGIAVVPVPGPSAVVAALSAAGVPADRFVFEGFLPVKPGRRLHRLAALRALQMTVVCYESPHRLLASLGAVAAVFGEVPMVLARELTKQFEEIVEGTPQALSERFAGGPIRGEFTLIIPYTKRPCASPEP